MLGVSESGGVLTVQMPSVWQWMKAGFGLAIGMALASGFALVAWFVGLMALGLPAYLLRR